MRFKDEILEALQIDLHYDAGAGPRRSPATEERYRYVAKRVLLRAGVDGKPGTIAEAVAFLVAIAPGLRHPTVRQYRASLLQHMRDGYSADQLSLDDIEVQLDCLCLFGPDKLHHGGSDLPVRCGAARRRGLLPDEYRETVLKLRALKTEMAKTLENLLIVGDMVGLRPWEWPYASVQGSSLTVQSAKMSERMGRGLTGLRELNLTPLGSTWTKRITVLCRTLRREEQEYGSPALVMARYARLLRAVRCDPRMSLRSLRHAFCANAKEAGWNTAQIAVAMNHSSAESQRAYGREGRGSRRLDLPWIDEPMTEFIRPSRPHEAERTRLAAAARAAQVLSYNADYNGQNFNMP